MLSNGNSQSVKNFLFLFFVPGLAFMIFLRVLPRNCISLLFLFLNICFRDGGVKFDFGLVKLSGFFFLQIF